MSPEYLNLWIELLEVTRESQGNPKVVFPLLQANKNKLNAQFAQLPAYWVAFALPRLTSQQAVTVAITILEFSDLMQQFSPDNREIAIAGYGAALMVLNRQDFPQHWVRIQINLAVAYRNHHLGDRALNLERAIECYQSALQLISRDGSKETWALVYANLAVAYIDRILGERADNLEQAIACCQRALEVYNRQDFPLDWAMVYNSLAVAYRTRIYDNRSENLENAIACYQQALQVYTREQFPTQWATTLSNLGNAYRTRLQGDRSENLEQAISCCEQALEVLTLAESPLDWARTQRYLGSAYRQRIRGQQTENLERAITAYQSALQGYQQQTTPQDWAMSQNDLALAYIECLRVKDEDAADDLEQAIACCENALQVFTSNAFPEQRARTLNTLGFAYTVRLNGDRAENLEQAIASYREALQFYTYETLPEQWARTYNNLGHALKERIQGNRRENLQDAVTAYQQALRVYTPTTFPENYVKTQSGLGLAEQELGQLHAAYEAFEAAIERLEFLRSEIISGDVVKQKLAQEWNDLYEDMVSLCLQLAATEPHYASRALEYIERNKARNLVELLSLQDILPKGEIPTVAIEELQNLRRRLAAEERSLLNAEAEDYRRFDQLRQQFNQFVEVNIKPLDPTFSATQKVDSISFAQIQALLDDTTVALAWYVTKNYFLTFVVTRQSEKPQVFRFEEGDRNALRDWINSYFQHYLHMKTNWQTSLTDQLQALSKILHLEQIVKLIPNNYKQLILIPHRFLHLLPLHALPIKNSQKLEASQVASIPQQTFLSYTLLDRFLGGARYAPSFQALQLTQDRHRPAFNRFFGVQNPTDDLSYADIEVAEIAKVFQPHTEILVKEAAHKAAILAAFQTAHCTHFACHGYFDFDAPLQSALVLAGAKATSSQNFSSNEECIDLEMCLSLGEIFGLDLSQCRLVTLSACETGLTDFRSITDEYIGLPSGFLYAGSPTVVSSLWTVNDLSTAFLMIKFYQNLWRGTPGGLALNQAQLWLRNLTKVELQKWIEENQLQLSPTLKISLYRRFHNLPDNDQPFWQPFHWAGFCATGQ